MRGAAVSSGDRAPAAAEDSEPSGVVHAVLPDRGHVRDEWSVIDIVAAENDESLGFFSFSGRLGSAPADVGSGTTDLETEVIIGPLVSGRRYAVSTSAGGSGTFSLDDRDVSATLTFVGETASGVRMAWTAECMRE